MILPAPCHVDIKKPPYAILAVNAAMILANMALLIAMLTENRPFTVLCASTRPELTSLNKNRVYTVTFSAEVLEF